MIRKFKNKNGGFSVLFASLIGSLVLAIGLAILTITLKQITLASAGRESQRAFYAADTGTEFALYLDRGGANSEDCPNGIFPIPGQSNVICGLNDFEYQFDGQTLNDDGSGLDENENFVAAAGSTQSITTINVRRTDISTNPVCFDITVTKSSDNDGMTVETEIEVRGYNTCKEDATNRFERAIKTTY